MTARIPSSTLSPSADERRGRSILMRLLDAVKESRRRKAACELAQFFRDRRASLPDSFSIEFKRRRLMEL